LSAEERNTWVQAVVTAAAYIVYAVVILNRAGSTALSEVAYAGTMIWITGATIVTMITGLILSAIFGVVAKKENEQKADERGKRTSVKGDSFGLFALATGAGGAMVLAMLEAPHFWIANAIFLGFTISSVLSSIVRIISYRRGL
jgi:hypothetical protein